MEPANSENMSLRKDSQKKFNNAMNSIKRLIKVGKVKVPDGKKKPVNLKGVVMIKHIPHGFYEKQMLLFFKQFGKVTNLKLYRSHRTGKSLGYAFVEFLHKEVAAIVAETMNNYLMFTKLLKAVLVEDPTPKIFMGRHFDETNCAGAIRRKKERIRTNKILSEGEATARKLKSAKKINKMKKKMDFLGLDCDMQVAGDISDLANETANSSIVSVEFSSDEEISVRMRRKSIIDTVNIPNKKKKLTKKNLATSQLPAVASSRRSTRISVAAATDSPLKKVIKAKKSIGADTPRTKKALQTPRKGDTIITNTTTRSARKTPKTETADALDDKISKTMMLSKAKSPAVGKAIKPSRKSVGGELLGKQISSRNTVKLTRTRKSVG